MSPWGVAGILLVALLVAYVAVRAVGNGVSSEQKNLVMQSGTTFIDEEDAVIKQSPRVAFLGSSYAEGVGTDHVSKAFVVLASQELGWSPYQFTVGGSGYSGPPGRSYGDRLDEVIESNPTHVVVTGSRNDADATAGVVEQKAAELYKRVREELPEATLIVVGPMWHNLQPSADVLRVNDEVRSAAEKADAVFLDALDVPWLDGSPELLAPDGLHPSEEGHARMADQFVREIQKAGVE